MTEEERRDLEREARLQRVLRQRPRDLRIPSFTSVETRLRRRTPLPVVLATSAVAIVLALVIGSAVADWRAATPAGSPSPAQSAVPATASPGPSESPTPAGSATPSLLSDRFGFVWVEDPRGLLQVRPEAGGTGSTLVARPYGFNDCGCKVSPDGTRIAYWINRATPENVELRVLDLSRPAQPTTIYTTPSGQRISGAAWSSDGTGILLAVEGVNPPGSPVGNPPAPALLAIEATGGAARTLDTDAGVYVPLGWDRTAGTAAAALSGEGGYMTGYITVRTSGDPAPKRTPVSESIYVMSVDVSSDQRFALGVFFEQGQAGGTVRWWRLADFAPTDGPRVDTPLGVAWRPGTTEIAFIEGDTLQLFEVVRQRGRSVGTLPSTGYMVSTFRHDGSAAAVTNGQPARASRTLLIDLASGASEIITGPGYIAGAVRLPTSTPSADPTRSPDPAEQAAAEALLRFARAPSAATLAAVPFAERISLGLGTQLLSERSRPELARPDAWILHMEGFRAHVGPFSALERLARATTTEVVAGPHPHCASPPMPAPQDVAGSRQVSIQPTGIDTCLLWFTVDLFLDPSGQIVAVTLDLWEP